MSNRTNMCNVHALYTMHTLYAIHGADALQMAGVQTNAYLPPLHAPCHHQLILSPNARTQNI